MRKKQAILGALIMLWLFGASVSSPEPGVLLKDDAYHYRYFEDGKHDGNYIEWWYFNFFDEVQDIQMTFTYIVLDPTNLSGRGTAGVAALAFTPKGKINAVDFFPTDLFSASYEQADVEIETSFIQVIDSERYRIAGTSADKRLSWDLIYERQAGSWIGVDRKKVGLAPWEQTSWLIYMPGAYVNGQVEIDGQVYTLSNVRGYHDHNWGEWIPSNVGWNWVQYFEPGLTFGMSDFKRRAEGVVSIEFQGDRTIFTKDQYRVTHTSWSFDSENYYRYPIETQLHAENETKRLVINLSTCNTKDIQLELPFPLPTFILYEQPAHYEGQLWEKNFTGEWESLVSFSGFGFKEYSGKKLVK